MGPFSDALFLSILHKYTYANSDREHIPVILDGNCKRADRSDFLIGKNNESPLDSLMLSAKRLVSLGAEIIAVPCNTAHFWIKEIEKECDRKAAVINMIREVVLACEEQGISRAVVLATRGTYKAGLYSSLSNNCQTEFLIPSSEIIEETSSLIRSIKSGEVSCKSQLLKLSKDACDMTKCNAVITGCTELSVALLSCTAEETAKRKINFIDSISVLAKSAIIRCGGTPRAIPFT